MIADIYRFYENNVKTSQQEILQLDKKINNNSFARLGVIVMGGAVLFKTFQTNNLPLVLGAFLGIVLLFVYLVNRQSKLEKARNQKRAFLQINENEIAQQQGHPNIYDHGESFADGKHPYTADLDIFGHYSLFEKVNRAATRLGIDHLANWFLKAADKKTLLQRQEAVAELAQNKTWLQDFQAKLVFNLHQKLHVKTFLKTYFQDSGFSFGNKGLWFYVQAVPFIFIIGLLISLTVYNLSGYLIILAIIHLLWTMVLGAKVSLFSSRADKVGVLLDSYADAIQLIEQSDFKSPLLLELKKRLLIEEKTPLSAAFKSLALLINKLDARNNMLVGAVLNMTMLWDFRQVMAIVKWKGLYQENILDAFDVIAEYEGLLSLAVLRMNNPDWATAILLDNVQQDAIHALDLAHPLIKNNVAVANDYTNIRHRIALVTGSNMAGKSTFLRTVGINAVLAYAGGVVFAKHFEIPIYDLITYMRIKDNLNESTSTFKAELDRMKFILETVATNEKSFFLIDEMLRGTNSVDKYLGSRAIIKKLIKENAVGMVATHDLQLSTLADEYPTIVQNYHFDIQVNAGEMLFDYKLKDGECKIFNASMLLKGIGVDVESEKN